MVFDFFRGGGQSTIEEVEATLVEMMHNARHVYDEAMGAVFGGGKSKETKRGSAVVRSLDCLALPGPMNQDGGSWTTEKEVAFHPTR